VGDHPWLWIASHKARGFGEAVGRLMPMGNFLLTLAVICSATSALNATIYSATRASYALGRDGMLPKPLARISAKRKTPWVALSCSGIIVLCVATFLPTMDVASSASIMFLFLFFLVNICVIRIRLHMGDELDYGFLMPFFPVLPIVAIICQAILAIGLGHISPMAWIIAPSWIGAGLLIYWFYARHHAEPSEGEIRVLEEDHAPSGDQYRIMVSVANPDTVLPLVKNTYRLCEAKQARVELLHMVPVPDQVPLSDADEFMLEGREGIVEAMLYLAALFPVSTTFRYCRSVARGIISAVREKKVDMLLLGWHGRRTSRTFEFGSTIDPVMERCPSNVVIMKNCGNDTYRHVLVPLAGGRNGAFALEVAHMLAEPRLGRITAFNVEQARRSFDLDAFVAEHRERLGIDSDRIQVRTVGDHNVVARILSESEEYDLVVLGCTRQSMLKRMISVSVPEKVARVCQKPLIMVKAAGGVRTLLQRWI
jgi:nucleotide-binding universal stress UspA family protein